MSLASLRRAATLVAAVATLVSVDAPSATAQAATDLSGTWKGTFTSDGPTGTVTLTIVKEGASYKVTNLLEGDQVPPPSGDPRDWKTEGSAFSFTQTYADFDVIFKGTAEAGVIKGTLEAYQGGSMVGTGSFELKKQ